MALERRLTCPGRQPGAGSAAHGVASGLQWLGVALFLRLRPQGLSLCVVPSLRRHDEPLPTKVLVKESGIRAPLGLTERVM